MQRRLFLHGAGLTAGAFASVQSNGALAQVDSPLDNSDASSGKLPPGAAFLPPQALAPIRATADRIIQINVCTRPFRAAGPRIEMERIGRKHVIHCYGHGGSGWSLSWGNAKVIVPMAQATGEKRIAIIGCGAIGLTAALVAQRAGLKVRIYAKERMPEVRSSWATGAWTPDSRICTQEALTPEFAKQWEAMARHSFWMYQNFLGTAGTPVEWKDNYIVSDTPFGPGEPAEGEPLYPKLERTLLADLDPEPVPMPAGTHPFPVPYVRRTKRMIFNISSYARILMSDFMLAGGEIETVEFKSPKDFAQVPEKTLINCTGYGARALMGDESIIPVRGQTAKLVPQPEVNYGVAYASRHVGFTPRSDGLLVQAYGPGDFNNTDTTPDRAASVAAVAQLATLFPVR